MSAFAITEEIERAGQEIVVTGAAYHHLAKVRRTRVGQQVRFVDSEETIHFAECRSHDKGRLAFAIQSSHPRPYLGNDGVVRLLVLGVPALNSLKIVLPMLPQLGFDRVFLIPVQRSPYQLKEAEFIRRQDKWHRLLREGGIVAERFALPQLTWVAGLREFLSSLERASLVVGQTPEPNQGYSYTLPEQYSFRGLDADKRKRDSLTEICLFVGPEGGFAPEEMVLLRDQGAMFVTVGNEVMETPVALAALRGYLQGRLYW